MASLRRCLRRLSRRWSAVVVVIIVVVTFLRSGAPLQRDDSLTELAAPNRTPCACIHPRLQLWPKSIKRYSAANLSQLPCSGVMHNWVNVKNGTLLISEIARSQFERISCQVEPIIRGKNDFELLKGIRKMNVDSGYKITSDFFEVRCEAANGSVYNNVHSGIVRRPEIVQRSLTSSTPNGRERQLNILMFGFDSTSRMSWLRHLPKSHDYFVNVLGGVVMEGYNIVGDGTPAALLPILTGKNETELPEARRGFKGAKPVDDHPWIWTRLKQAGYTTQYGEDMASIGTFHYRMLGFNKQPVDHYMRPFYMYAERTRQRRRPFCFGATPRHVNMMHWVRQFFDAYKNTPKFSFLFYSEFSHGEPIRLTLLDDDLVMFLRTLKDAGHLENTLLVLMSDHGARFHSVRQSVQGKQEERMPYMGLRLPPTFTQQYPKVLRNLKLNIDRLTTPYDIHATFVDVMNYSTAKASKGNISERGISLLKEIPAERTCLDAGIELHWCACVDWTDVSVQNGTVRAAAEKLMDVVNAITEDKREVCLRLAILSIKRAQIYAPKQQLLRFKQSADYTGYRADLSDNMKTVDVHYQITVVTQPGEAIYEATVALNKRTELFTLDIREISRTNRYGNQPHCVAADFPHMRQYCYCEQQLLA